MKRTIKFDQNREGLEMTSTEELTQQIQQLHIIVERQEQQVLQYQQQLQQQQQQLHQQQQQQRPQQMNELMLGPHHIINQFRQLKALDRNHNLPSFIKAVESIMALCGQNQQLMNFGLQIITTEKIIGDANNTIRELEDNTTWEDVKRKLKQQFKPTKTYAEVFNHCRLLKVSNMKELLDIFIKSKYEINNLYQYDERRPELYTPENIDRDLTEILLEKIDGQFRAYIDNETTLKDIYEKYARLRLLEDSRTIDYRHRIQPRITFRENQNRQQPTYNRNLPQHKQQQPTYNDNSRQYRQESNYPRQFIPQNSGQVRQQQPTYNNNSRQFEQQNSRQFRQQQPTYNINNTNNDSRQSRNHTNTTQSKQQSNSNNRAEMMEIGNIEEKDINFTETGLNDHYP